ncbi:MAG: 2-hydroxychromene-2-carboxylate isomerase [Myxococcales bacterium]|nr:2-hydroxychromene-2-carboxylate isomerase [Myxococcales bacterium]
MRHVVMSSKTLRFYFDYLSPYSYLAWQEIPLVARRHALQLKPTPVLLAALLDHHGHKGPGEIAPKRAYVFKDCVRRAATLGVPFEPPFSHPFNPLPALRVTMLDMGEERRLKLITRLFAATWAEARDVSSPEVVGAICNEVGVPNALERVQDPVIKQRLRDVTTEAIELGVFGVPTMLIGDELFWGTDSLRYFESHLAGDDPVSTIDPAAWDAVRASAMRKRSR